MLYRDDQNDWFYVGCARAHPLSLRVHATSYKSFLTIPVLPDVHPPLSGVLLADVLDEDVAAVPVAPPVGDELDPPSESLVARWRLVAVHGCKEKNSIPSRIFWVNSDSSDALLDSNNLNTVVCS